jgi:hypothetical protein
MSALKAQGDTNDYEKSQKPAKAVVSEFNFRFLNAKWIRLRGLPLKHNYLILLTPKQTAFAFTCLAIIGIIVSNIMGQKHLMT